MKLRLVIASILLIAIAACSAESDYQELIPAPQVAAAMENGRSLSLNRQKSKSAYLSYEHSLEFEVSQEMVEAVYRQLSEACSQATAKSCQLLSSHLNKGDYYSAYLQLRLTPNQIDGMIELAGTFGHLVSRRTQVEDLQEAIVDQGKRLEMLHQYRQRLQKLEQHSTESLDSLIRIAKELSQVQTDLEYAEGQKAKLIKRTQMDILNIRLSEAADSSFWGGISDSFSYFFDNLSAAISQVITGIAYILPWSLFLAVFLWSARLVRRYFFT